MDFYYYLDTYFGHNSIFTEFLLDFHTILL